jgi:hypothetical protein
LHRTTNYSSYPSLPLISDIFLTEIEATPPQWATKRTPSQGSRNLEKMAMWRIPLPQLLTSIKRSPMGVLQPGFRSLVPSFYSLILGSYPTSHPNPSRSLLLTGKKGNRKHLRRLSNLLHELPRRNPFQHLLDRLHPSLSPPPDRRRDRTTLRCWIFPALTLHWVVFGCVWINDDVYFKRVLAGDVGASGMYRIWMWMSFCA